MVNQQLLEAANAEFSKWLDGYIKSYTIELHRQMIGQSAAMSTTKVEEETDASLLMAGGGPPTMGSLDTAQESKPGKTMKVKRAKTARGKKVKRSLFKRLRVRKRWQPAVSLAVDDGSGQWITIGGKHNPETGEKHVGGFKVKVSKDGTITTGRLRGKKVSDVKSYFDRKNKGASDAGQQSKRRRTIDRGRGGPTQPSSGNGGQVAPKVGRPDTTAAGNKPVSTRSISRIPATREEANRRLDRYSNLFRSRGQHQVAEWMDKLRNHINEVGTDSALASLGEEIQGKGEATQYAGHAIEGEHDADFIEAYLDRNGISLLSAPVPEGPARAISTVTPSSDEEGTKSRGNKRDVFPVLQGLRDKLHEAQNLPGLQKSEDLSKLMGGEFGAKVPQFSQDVLKKLDDTYGEGKWIVKSYGDEAYAGYGIFFPQRVAQIRKDAQNTIWAAGEQVSRHGFSLDRDPEGKVIGLEHTDGKRYKFGSPEYNKTIQGDVRYWGDKAAQASNSERATPIPEGKFMAQPAFPVVGISDEERAQGVTFKTGQEGRVHIHTRNGKAEIIPHSTWLKNEHLPVVFESDDTRAMAQAAVDAINALPESERKGQLYAPDIVRTADGYRVVEANPANEAGASGYLQSNPLIIDSYVSHVTGREPSHVRFVRKLLSKKVAAMAAALAIVDVAPVGTDSVVVNTGSGVAVPTVDVDSVVPDTRNGKPPGVKKPRGTNATREDMPEKVSVADSSGKLRAVMVGRLENDVLPAWYPSFSDPDGNEVGGPETAGQTKKQYDPEMYERAVEQTEALCEILEKEGVKVFRPPLVKPEDAQAAPVGLGAEWAREVFSVFGNKLVINQTRAAHRNKDHVALEPFFQSLEQAGKCTLHRLPQCDWERRDDDLRNDPRPFLEGGDIFRSKNDVIVTMSYLASSPAGYRWLSDLLAPDGTEVWPAYLSEEFEHGDYVFLILREGLCMAYLDGFVDGLLPSPITDWDVVALTKEEANERFAANGLVLDENKLLIPSGSPRVVRALERKGVEVIQVPFNGPIYWQGAIRCATSELWRD